jgi:hypothetical protein
MAVEHGLLEEQMKDDICIHLFILYVVCAPPSYTSTPQYIFMAYCLIKQEQLTFYSEQVGL